MFTEPEVNLGAEQSKLLSQQIKAHSREWDKPWGEAPVTLEASPVFLLQSQSQHCILSCGAHSGAPVKMTAQGPPLFVQQ